MESNLWIEEKQGDFLGMRYKVDRVLFSGKSDFQSVDLVETRGHGKMLLNDGLVMVSERDEFVYHDMMAHVPLFIHPHPKKVLVIGGGDGGTAREVCRHKSVEKCTVVEIDAMVVEACRKFLPLCAQGFDHPKTHLIIGDGVEFVEKAAREREKFDLILIDSTDPIGPATPLFGSTFYRNLEQCLDDKGIIISQGESPWYEKEIQMGLIKMLNEIFPIVSIYNFNNLTYPGGQWSFSFVSKGLEPLEDFNPRRVKESLLEFKYYTEEIHRASFALPQFMLNHLAPYLKMGKGPKRW